MKKRVLPLLLAALLVTACNRVTYKHDASGIFEATEVIISAQAAGKIEELNLTEGDVLKAGQLVGYIDTIQLYLKKLQLQVMTKAVSTKKVDVGTQIAAINEQIAKAEIDKKRVDNLFNEGASTQQQVDDVHAQLAVLRRNLAAAQNSLTTSVSSLSEESSAYAIQVAQVEDQLQKCYVVNPLEGTVLSKYAQAQEVAAVGKPLYKLADVSKLFLRAYLLSAQLSQVTIGQKVSVFMNTTPGKQERFEGRISWISSKAEFTPKTIQTQDERQNLVYAVKIEVPNPHGVIKIGMYGDVDF